MVGVFAVVDLHVQIAKHRLREAAEEFARQLGVEAAHAAAAQGIGPIHECCAPAEVDGDSN